MVNLIQVTSNTFSAAANFLQYSNSLRVVRATQTSAVNASTSGTGVLIKNTDDWTNNYASGGSAVTQILLLERSVQMETIYLFQFVQTQLLMKKTQ